MEEQEIQDLKYPIGKPSFPKEINMDENKANIEIIRHFPKGIKNLVNDLSETQLNWKYRPDGWSIKQVVHHTADSHMNAVVRTKLALTEQLPKVTGYQEALWAELPDGVENQVSDSLMMLEGMHNKWANLLESLTPEDYEKKYHHMAMEKEFTLNWVLALYTWHCRHHTAHIEQALKYEGKF